MRRLTCLTIASKLQQDFPTDSCTTYYHISYTLYAYETVFADPADPCNAVSDDGCCTYLWRLHDCGVPKCRRDGGLLRAWYVSSGGGWVGDAAACCGRCLRVKIRDDYVKLTGGPKVCSSWIRLPQQT